MRSGPRERRWHLPQAGVELKQPRKSLPHNGTLCIVLHYDSAFRGAINTLPLSKRSALYFSISNCGHNKTAYHTPESNTAHCGDAVFPSDTPFCLEAPACIPRARLSLSRMSEGAERPRPSRDRSILRRNPRIGTWHALCSFFPNRLF